MAAGLLEKFQVQVKRSRKRRTLCLRVIDGQVRLNVPFYAPKYELEQFVADQSHWLLEQMQKQDALKEKQVRHFELGCVLPFLGNELTISLNKNHQKPYALNGKLYLSASLFKGLDEAVEQERRKKAIEAWYRAQCLTYVQQQVAFYQQQMQIQSRGVKVRAYKRRWGSCSHNGELQFNWLLAMAPMPVVDYVVVHELAHIRHFNHSKAFWDLVSTYCPDYKTHRQWLKTQTSLFWS